MIKKFHTRIPLAFEDSFALLCNSGSSITSWKIHKSNSEEGIIEFKQSLFAMTGSATIIAQLEQTDKEETSVDIIVQKKGQFLDPFGICYRVFKKLDKAWQKNLRDQ